MNDRKIQLRKRHYEEIKMKHPPLLLSSSGSVFFYSTANGALRLFYSESGKNVKLPHSSFVTSRPSSLCLSPSHAFGLVFFDDGSILLYDLLENKIIKTLSKELKGKVTHSVFLNDTQILVYDDAFQLSVLTLQNYSIFGFAIQKKSLNFYQSFMNQLIVPPTHLAIKEEPNDINYGSFCVSPIFSKVFAFSLSKRIIVVNIPDNSQKLQVIYDIELKNDDLCDRPFISFNLPNPDTLYFSYTTKRRIVVLKIASENLSKSNSNEPKVIFETDLKSPPKFNAFLSSSVVSVICEDDLVYLFSFLGFQ
ncbi:hypothetical protein TRFO_40783 [Tritrichomonas foetus]|uniref:Uncharacterized protein n=1 Tax=Tritrichomonas foetus TaxID=1144522 RepID=A0A1J4J2C8_9EUKA|nr:hypothetical protein TRFO_40783 [Tritrichomonas foetus]|eukprot:OHS92897.1 hypothetical protein TRFO_40783 [Tritrichomonas foetus]